MRRLAALALLASLAAPMAAAAQDTAPAVELRGRVTQPGRLTLAELQAMPAASVTVTQATSHGPQSSTFSGVLLLTVLQRSGLLDEPGERTHLRHTILAIGRDGYAVALAIGELEPDFAGKPVLIAWTQDGKPLPGLRLVVPGDAHAGRGVHDLATLEVR